MSYPSNVFVIGQFQVITNEHISMFRKLLKNCANITIIPDMSREAISHRRPLHIDWRISHLNKALEDEFRYRVGVQDFYTFLGDDIAETVKSFDRMNGSSGPLIVYRSNGYTIYDAGFRSIGAKIRSLDRDIVDSDKGVLEQLHSGAPIDSLPVPKSSKEMLQLYRESDYFESMRSQYLDAKENQSLYRNVSACVAAIVTPKLVSFIAIRGSGPSKGYLALPGLLVQEGNPSELVGLLAAVEKQTGLKLSENDFVDRREFISTAVDPRGIAKTRVYLFALNDESIMDEESAGENNKVEVIHMDACHKQRDLLYASHLSMLANTVRSVDETNKELLRSKFGIESSPFMNDMPISECDEVPITVRRVRS